MQHPAKHNDPSTFIGHVGSKKSLRLALGIALMLHGLVLLLPIDKQVAERHETPAQIELRFTTHEPPQPPMVIAIPETMPEPLSTPESTPELADQTITPPDVSPEAPEINPTEPSQTLIPINRDYQKMSSEEKRRLTHTILSSQFITQEPVADRLFGKPIQMDSDSVKKEFHYPIQPNLVSMLDKPMQELPFKYTPGLVHFAYAPGVKGDLQRFWDVITPEFGWTTKYGTQVKCIWVLVIAGCGWK
jgi:hypothetical protein